MPGFTVQRSGFTRVPELYYSIVQDLIANGFDLVYPASMPAAPVSGTPYAPFKATLYATAALDPFNATEPWAIHFNANASQKGDVFVSTPLQLPADGTVAQVSDTASGNALPDQGTNAPLYSGMLNTAGIVPTGPTTDLPGTFFISRANRMTPAGTENNYPMSYRITTASTGVVVFVWEDASDTTGLNFEYFCVQRPVDHVTGSATSPATAHNPMFCVFGMNGKNYRFTVRENDVFKPTLPTDAASSTPDSNAIMNGVQQVAITENNQYVITFPNGLNTQRYAYTTELDLIAYTSADVVSAYTDVPITVYGEGSPRTYKAMCANGANNTGMRILMLTAGGPMA